MTKYTAGFTLIELMIVVVIIGVLAAIAIPNFVSMQDRARESSVKSNMHTLQLAAEDFLIQAGGCYPVDLVQSVSQANPDTPNNLNSIAGEEPANGQLGAGALLPGGVKNPIVPANNTAQTEHPAPAWDQAHNGTCSVDFMDQSGAQAAGSPSNAKSFVITGYGRNDRLDLVIQSGR